MPGKIVLEIQFLRHCNYTMIMKGYILRYSRTSNCCSLFRGY
jgi:hypothetical protein